MDTIDALDTAMTQYAEEMLGTATEVIAPKYSTIALAVDIVLALACAVFIVIGASRGLLKTSKTALAMFVPFVAANFGYKLIALLLWKIPFFKNMAESGGYDITYSGSFTKAIKGLASQYLAAEDGAKSAILAHILVVSLSAFVIFILCVVAINVLYAVFESVLIKALHMRVYDKAIGAVIGGFIGLFAVWAFVTVLTIYLIPILSANNNMMLVDDILSASKIVQLVTKIPPSAVVNVFKEITDAGSDVIEDILG